jgi:hypothetical protein
MKKKLIVISVILFVIYYFNLLNTIYLYTCDPSIKCGFYSILFSLLQGLMIYTSTVTCYFFIGNFFQSHIGKKIISLILGTFLTIFYFNIALRLLGYQPNPIYFLQILILDIGNIGSIFNLIDSLGNVDILLKITWGISLFIRNTIWYISALFFWLSIDLFDK